MNFNENFTIDDMIISLDQYTNGIFIYDSELTLLYANSFARNINHISDDMIGKTWNELKDNGFFYGEAAFKVYKYHSPFPDEYITKEGRHIITNASPVFDRKGNLKYIISDVRDITMFNKMRSSVREIKSELSKVQDFIRKVNKNEKPFLYKSRAMEEMIASVAKIAKTDISVLIEGETGVGKSLLAAVVQKNSCRGDLPFITVNCAAIPHNLCEAEFFGYEKGAFTGAVAAKRGLFEMANNGTLFLDEIGELPVFMQVKLLRVLQEKKCMRIGGEKEIDVNVRIISATNKDLKMLVSKQRFREDLYHRLNGFRITVPPLRERKEDLEQQIGFYLDFFNTKYSTTKSLTDEALQLLLKYRYPGNSRELSYILEKIVVLSPENRISREVIGKVVDNDSADEAGEDSIPRLKDAVEKLERGLLLKAKARYGTTRRMAEVLGLSHVTVAAKLKQYGL